MNPKCAEFVELVSAGSPSIAEAVRREAAWWSPDEPPVTVLFGAIGAQIFDDITTSGVKSGRAVFAEIEKAMNDTDEQLGTAIATGLIEALVNRAASDDVWPSLRDHLGDQTRRHAEAWLAF